MEGSTVHMIDQPRLPHTFQIAKLANHRDTANAISTMIVRGAGAIGATGAYGMAQAALEAPDDDFHRYIEHAANTMSNTRCGRISSTASIQCSSHRGAGGDVAQARGPRSLQRKLWDDDAACCGHRSSRGATYGARVCTRNAGWLAFVDWGSASPPSTSLIGQGTPYTCSWMRPGPGAKAHDSPPGSWAQRASPTRSLQTMPRVT